MTAVYFSEQGILLSEIQQGMGCKVRFTEKGSWQRIEYKDGIPDGKVENFNQKGLLSNFYHIKNGKKQGEEIYYFPFVTNNDTLLPKLQLHWDDDSIHGTVKTWYENGKVESQKEIHRNKKNGMNCGWYKEGDLMFVEEYENDRLINGTYYKLHVNQPISKVSNGSGIATLFDGSNGHFLRKVTYTNYVVNDER